MKTKLSVWLGLGSILLSFSSVAQSIKTIDFPMQEVTKELVSSQGTLQIQATKAKYFQFDPQPILAQLEGIASRETGIGFTAEISLPNPDGTFQTYLAKGNRTMHDDLAARFPEIKSFDAHGEDGSFVKWDITPKGLHAMIFRPGVSTIFIDPAIHGNNQYYIVYHRADFVTDKQKDCQFNSDVEQLESKHEPVSGEQMKFGTCELRTYRLALAATAEYTIFQGGTVNDALAAQVTTMNRVNGVYEKDMAITMVIIANNDLLIYTNTSSDPYTNGNPNSMIVQNQNNVTSVIGSANYDIGHVFGTNSGGLAGLGVVCSSSQKAGGVTGSGAPTGDSFDIDYVAHEMGHQFGADHTFNNSCSGNRNNATAVEPGSGSTIMAYAGICSPNVQSNSDDHFSGISLQQISTEILSSGHQCEVISPLSNTAPIILSTTSSAAIPAGTPFALTAVVTDPDNDVLTYNWEQMDNEISTQAPVATSTGGPNFRSWPSSTDPTRYFPKLTAVANNGPFTWERLPTVSRTMDFRVSVRDNSTGSGGCTDHQDITLTVDGNSGPFVVTYPSAVGIVWYETESRTVTWDVANTNNAPVNCSTVDIFLSTNGGSSYPITLATGVPNDGSETITVPSNITTTARVMVMNSQGTFFDVSDKNFTIAVANVGLDEVVNSGVEIYPNPTSNSVTVRWEENVTSVQLTDAQGKILREIDARGFKETAIDMQSLSMGMYFVSVVGDEGRSVHPLVKK